MRGDVEKEVGTGGQETSEVQEGEDEGPDGVEEEETGSAGEPAVRVSGRVGVVNDRSGDTAVVGGRGADVHEETVISSTVSEGRVNSHLDDREDGDQSEKDGVSELDSSFDGHCFEFFVFCR